MGAPILIGTANWADHEDFYPSTMTGRRATDRLRYYAQYFPIVEVDTTFYGIPRPSTVEAWLQRTPPGFRFNVKTFRSLTGHDRVDGVPRRPTPDEEGDFSAALEPLRAAGRLVAVHYQFPPWFTDTPGHREWLLDARERHPADTLAVEFRHRSWFGEEAWPRTEELLREMEATYVMVDAPQIGDASAPPVVAVTNPALAIIRLHGRNRRTWYIRNAASSRDRFDYLYAPSELEGWAGTARQVSDAGTAVHILLNNNRGNQAVVNAYDMAGLLGVELPRPPQPVVATIRARDGGDPAWLANAPRPVSQAVQGVGTPPADGQLDLPVWTEPAN